jgi:predicted nucleic acid-binding protein
VDRVFLDANVLFSAAYSPDAGFRRLWQLTGVTLITSTYAIAEARRNLPRAEQVERLDLLLADLQVVDPWDYISLPADIELPEKDVPILQAAIAAAATHLVTGDIRAFGPYFGRNIGGIEILRPAAYLRSREQLGGGQEEGEES